MSPGWPDNRYLPEFNMNEVRDIIFQWLDLLVQREEDARTLAEKLADSAEAGSRLFEAHGPDREDRLDRIAAIADDLKLAADKSSYLGRRFSGEIHRTEPCPKHKGVWSGLGECDYGCEQTGWLPRVVPKCPTFCSHTYHGTERCKECWCIGTGVVLGPGLTKER